MLVGTDYGIQVVRQQLADATHPREVETTVQKVESKTAEETEGKTAEEAGTSEVEATAADESLVPDSVPENAA